MSYIFEHFRIGKAKGISLCPLSSALNLNNLQLEKGP